MTKRYLLLITILTQGSMINGYLFAQKKLQINWSIPASLPVKDSLGKNSGLAGAFAGIHNDALLIAGGANFPNAMPWQGGKKVYWDDVYVLTKKDNGNLEWYTQQRFKLKQRIAYGASVSTDQGIVCAGGENEIGIVKDVFLLQWDKEKKCIVITDLPSLPIPLANASAAGNGKMIYVAGGITTSTVSDNFYALDLNNISVGWQELPPIPQPVSHAVMAIQSGGNQKNIYLIGGRKQKMNGISELYRSVLEFDLLKMQWVEKKSLPYALSAGTGIAVGKNIVLLFGGDKGEIFHKTELLISEINSESDDNRKKLLVDQKNKLQESHPGFSKKIFQYNTDKDKWIAIGEMPFETPVTTTAVKWQNEIFIPSGEIKAGVRTPYILFGRLKH